MDRFRFCIVFLILHVNPLNSIVVQIKPQTLAKEFYLSLPNVSLKKSQLGTENMFNFKPTKTNSVSIRNETFFTNQRILKLDNSTKRVTDSSPRILARRAPPPYSYVVHQTSDVKPIYEIETESTVGLAENHHTGYTYDHPSSNINELSNKYESKNVKGSCTPEEIIEAIDKLDRLLKPVLNSDGYNTPLHPPTNPVLALILSRYGRYLSGTRNADNVYSYMAVNNIHNIKPFGQYKHE